MAADPRFDFLSLFLAKDDDDAVPDYFFINDQCSPYSNINLNCKYLDTDEIVNLQTDKITILSLHIQSLPAKFAEFSELVNEFTS